MIPISHLVRDERVPDDADDEDQQEGVPELDLFLGLGLVGSDDLLAPPGGDRPDNGVVGIVGVRVDEDIEKILFWQEFRHRLCKHRLTRPRAPDHHDMPALDRGFPDHFDRTFLADHLIDQFCRDLDLGGGSFDNFCCLNGCVRLGRCCPGSCGLWLRDYGNCLITRRYCWFRVFHFKIIPLSYPWSIHII